MEFVTFLWIFSVTNCYTTIKLDIVAAKHCNTKILTTERVVDKYNSYDIEFSNCMVLRIIGFAASVIFQTTMAEPYWISSQAATTHPFVITARLVYRYCTGTTDCYCALLQINQLVEMKHVSSFSRVDDSSRWFDCLFTLASRWWLHPHNQSIIDSIQPLQLIVSHCY